MAATLLILALLVLAASLGSWLFSQWVSAAPRASALVLWSKVAEALSTRPTKGVTFSRASDARLRIRYLACYLSDTAATAVMHETIADDVFSRALLADDCYGRVISASQVGATSGQPPIISQP